MENCIYHYGVKGMKWGVRRTPEQLGHNRKKARDMSDDELNRRIARLEKERRYNDLVTPQHVKSGRRIVQAVLVASTIEVSKKYVSKYMDNYLDANLDGYIQKGMAAVNKVLKK